MKKTLISLIPRLLSFLLFICCANASGQVATAQSQNVEAELVEVEPNFVTIRFYSLTSGTVHVKTTVRVFDGETPKLQPQVLDVKVTPAGVFQTYHFPDGALGFYDTFKVTLQYRSEGWEIKATKSLYNSPPLPVTLKSFSSRKEGSGTILSWSTASEVNSGFYILQRSEDGISFGEVSRIKAAGQSSQERKYSFTDRQFGHTVYYRLKIVDLDGTEAYSATITVQPGKNYRFPITINGQAFYCEIGADERVRNIVLTDEAGRWESFSSAEILTARVATGIRVLYLVTDQKVISKKIWLN